MCKAEHLERRRQRHVELPLLLFFSLFYLSSLILSILFLSFILMNMSSKVFN